MNVQSVALVDLRSRSAAANRLDGGFASFSSSRRIVWLHNEPNFRGRQALVCQISGGLKR